MQTIQLARVSRLASSSARLSPLFFFLDNDNLRFARLPVSVFPAADVRGSSKAGENRSITGTVARHVVEILELKRLAGNFGNARPSFREVCCNGQVFCWVIFSGLCHRYSTRI